MSKLLWIEWTIQTAITFPGLRIESILKLRQGDQIKIIFHPIIKWGIVKLEEEVPRVIKPKYWFAGKIKWKNSFNTKIQESNFIVPKRSYKQRMSNKQFIKETQWWNSK